MTARRWITQHPWRAFAAYTCVSSMLYALATRAPVAAPWALAPTAWDAMIPFVPASVPVYMTYMAIMPTFVLLNRKHPRFADALMVACAYVYLNLFINIVFPTALQAPLSTAHPWGRLLLAHDTPYAVMPSGHVGLPWCLAWIARDFGGAGRRRFALWAAAMAVAVLTTKQHVVADVVAALVLAPLVVKAAARLHSRTPEGTQVAWPTLAAILAELSVCLLVMRLAVAWWSFPTALMAGAVIATRQHALFVLYHDAVHGHLARSRRLNDLLTNVCIGWPQLLPIHLYRPLHRRHHQTLGTSADPERILLYAGQPWNYRPLPGRALALQLLMDFCAVGLVKTGLQYKRELRNPASKLQLPADAVRWESLLAGVALAAGAGAFAITSPAAAWRCAALWFVPLLTATNLLQKLRSFAEHSDGVNCDVSYSWAPGWLGRATVWPYHINFHREHHRAPQHPWYRLPEKFAHVEQRDGGTLRTLLFAGPSAD